MHCSKHNCQSLLMIHIISTITQLSYSGSFGNLSSRPMFVSILTKYCKPRLIIINEWYKWIFAFKVIVSIVTWTWQFTFIRNSCANDRWVPNSSLKLDSIHHTYFHSINYIYFQFQSHWILIYHHWTREWHWMMFILSLVGVTTSLFIDQVTLLWCVNI